jgi:hypothetical protein
MDSFRCFPDAAISGSGDISRAFLDLGIDRFHLACKHVHQLAYGYNSDRDDMMTLFTEKKGSCTTKHAVIATLAAELALPVHKHIGIYAMTEAIVTGTAPILAEYNLPCIPMVHCFLTDGQYRVDLTEGNQNGKNQAIEVFLHAEQVIPNISARDEYRRYRKALTDRILKRPELAGIEPKTILQAREKGLVVLKAHVA